MNYETLLIERRDTAIWIRLNRADALNSLSADLVAELDGAIVAIETDPEVRTVVITGVGRAFSSGGDLKGLEDGAGGYRTAAPLFGAISRTLTRLELLEVPVIAAVNGMAIAGGLELVLACDIVIASDKAIFGDGHAHFGLLPGGGGSVRLPRKIGANRAKYMMMSGRTFPAAVLSDWGLVSEVVPHDGLEESVNRLTTELAAKSRLGLTRMKEMVDGGFGLPSAEAMAREYEICAAHDSSFDRNEGLRAFAEKQKPRFEGR